MARQPLYPFSACCSTPSARRFASPPPNWRRSSRSSATGPHASHVPSGTCSPSLGRSPSRRALSLLADCSCDALLLLVPPVSQLHYHIRLNADARADISWWQDFLPSWNGTAKFIAPNPTTAADLELFTDAAGTLGYGAYFRGAWFHYAWQPHQLEHSIQWKELFAIVAAALTWGSSWSGRKIRFFCDNQAIVLAWGNRRCKQPHIMALLCTLFFTAARHHFHVLLTHLPGTKNTLADALSRMQFTHFFVLAPQADSTPTAIPGTLTSL